VHTSWLYDQSENEPVPIEIPASGNMVQAGKVHGNQDDPPKQFGENISFMNWQTLNHNYPFKKNSNIN